MGTPQTLFTLLPEDVLAAMARLLTSRPRNANWTAWLDQGTAFSLLKYGCPIAEFTGVTHGFRRMDENCEPGMIYLDSYHPLSPQFWPLVSAIGTNLTHLSVTSIPWPAKIPDNCANLRHLKVFVDSMNGLLPHVLRACSSRLTTLELRGDKPLTRADIDAVAAHGAGVTRFALGVNAPGASANAIWPTVGPTLTDLAVKNPNLIMAHNITNCCPNITSLQVLACVSWDAADSVVQLCRSYGHKLLALRLMEDNSMLPHRQLTAALQHSPNAVVDAVVDGSDIATLQVLGGRLRTLEIVGGVADDMWALKESLNSLSRLEQLSICVTDSYKGAMFFSKFLETPKPHLRKLYIFGTERSKGAINEIAAIVAARVHSLEELIIEGPIVEPEEFADVVKKNPMLRRVLIDFDTPIVEEEMSTLDDDCEFAIEHAAQLLEQLAKSTEIKEVLIRNEHLDGHCSIIQTVASMFAKRSANIFVGGVQYTAGKFDCTV